MHHAKRALLGVIRMRLSNFVTEHRLSDQTGKDSGDQIEVHFCHPTEHVTVKSTRAHCLRAAFIEANDDGICCNKVNYTWTFRGYQKSFPNAKPSLSEAPMRLLLHDVSLGRRHASCSPLPPTLVHPRSHPQVHDAILDLCSSAPYSQTNNLPKFYMNVS